MPTDTEMQKFREYKDALKGKYGDAAYDSWFKPLSLVKFQNGHVVMGAPSTFTATQIRQRYARGLIELWNKKIGPISQMSIRGSGELGISKVRASNGMFGSDMPRDKAIAARNAETAGIPEKASARFRKSAVSKSTDADPLSISKTLAAPLNAALTFNSFCTSNSNHFAFIGARNVVEGSDDRLIFFHGASGLGKTHLLNAIGHEWLQRRPDENVLYLTYDNLLNGYVNAVLSKSVSELRAYLNEIDILLVDDIHLLRGRKGTQEELLCLIDRLIASDKTVVVAGAMTPAKLAKTGLNQRLTDRLGGGLCVQIDKPDYPLRLKILRQMVRGNGMAGNATIAENVLEMVARRCDESIRELEGAFKELRLYSQASEAGDLQFQLDEKRVAQLLHERLKYRSKELSLEDIKSAVTQAFGLSAEDIESKKRMQAIVRGRHAFCLVARRLTEAPLKQIGAVINRDHTTVLSSIDRASVLAETNPAFGDLISRIMEDLSQG